MSYDRVVTEQHPDGTVVTRVRRVRPALHRPLPRPRPEPQPEPEPASP